MCWDCYETMTEDYEDAIAPIVDRALLAFWGSISNDLPFFEKSNIFTTTDFEENAHTVVCDETFEPWQKSETARKIRISMPPDEED